jgi:hypothetical protein
MRRRRVGGTIRPMGRVTGVIVGTGGTPGRGAGGTAGRAAMGGCAAGAAGAAGFGVAFVSLPGAGVEAVFAGAMFRGGAGGAGDGVTTRAAGGGAGGGVVSTLRRDRGASG